MTKSINIPALLTGLSLSLMSGCSGLPDNSERTRSYAITDGESTHLGKAFHQELVKYPDQSGVFLLANGLDAFVARVLLARQAERSIDLQYYMFHRDTVGRLLINELLDAADRGVRVRMLIDDIYGEEGDDVWAALDAHPNYEVQLFNPFVRNRSKNLQWITRFKDVNYRMHSKTYTVDNQATIVGGRNTGDEYFNADPELAFTDLDVLAIGPVVPEVSKEFDEYWNSEYAYPVSALVAPATADDLNRLRGHSDAFSKQQRTSNYVEALNNSKLAKALRTDSARFSWADAKVIHDSSQKKAHDADWREELLISQLAPYIEQVSDELILVSPYFVPGKAGAAALCKLSQQGARVRVLTNSLASNDVAAVHAGYAKYRKQLLRCGVELYELDEQIKEQEQKMFRWLPGLSKSSLHAKTMAFDKKGMFVGSFNFDQRSLHINNEIGILFRNPEITERASDNFYKNIDKAAFKLELHSDGGRRETLRWHGQKDGKEVILDSEPYASFWKKFGAGFVGMLPVESLL